MCVRVCLIFLPTTNTRQLTNIDKRINKPSERWWMVVETYLLLRKEEEDSITNYRTVLFKI